MNGSRLRPAGTYGWATKPLRAMTHAELEHLRAVLSLETPPDCALLRAVDGRLEHGPTASGEDAAGPCDDEYIESDDWALDG
ncbi:hypothetical protein [Actinomadura sp. 9N407]|uniref:hypothetical protein n=1 Tax=Actinomadura sp. 9N407 TaxID=3375154 RepID=UPI0037BD9930